MLAELRMTLNVPKIAPFIHLRRYFISIVKLVGPSVKAFASGMY